MADKSVQDQLILAIDTCTPSGSLAVSKGSKVLAETRWDSPGSHSQVITDHLQELLANSGVALKQLDAIVVGHGPGSFTGIRIGLNLAKSLAYAFGLPVFEVSPLFGFAEIGSGQGLPVLSVVSAFRNLTYCARLRMSEETQQWELLLEPSALTYEEISDLITEPHSLVGDAAQAVLASLSSDLLKPIEGGQVAKASHCLRYFLRQSKDWASPKDWKQVSPLYVRASEAEEKLKKK